LCSERRLRGVQVLEVLRDHTVHAGVASLIGTALPRWTNSGTYAAASKRILRLQERTTSL
jgi:hypothetical protein